MQDVFDKSGLGRAHNDPTLTGSPKRYADFLYNLDQRGLLRWRLSTPKEAGRLGVFFVKKKDGRIRSVFDTRIVNTCFVEPPSTRLPSGAAISGIETPGPDSDVFVGTGDVENCFYNMGVPEGLSEYFTLNPVHAHLIGKTQLNGKALGPQALLTPCLAGLPMGWNWSLHFCQSAVSSIVQEATGFDRLVEDREEGIVLTAEAPRCAAAYVDSFAVFGLLREADKHLQCIIEACGTHGLPVHEIEPASLQAEFVGLEFDRGKLSIKAKRLRRLKFAISAILRRKKVSGRLSEVLVGHLTWALLVRRESLSILQQVYVYIREHYETPATLPPSVREELCQSASILPLLRADLTAPWSSDVICSDASPFGIGACHQKIDPKGVSAIGRCQEKWRFETEDHINARRAALGIEKHTSAAIAARSLESRELAAVAQSDEIPRAWLAPARWKVIRSGKIRQRTHH